MKKYLSSIAAMMMGAALLVSCDDNDNTSSIPVPVSNGAYVICGGNMSSNINGSVTYIDFATKTAAQNQFKAKNGREIGLTPNDAVVYGEKMYIVVSNENTIEVVNAKTLASIAQIKTTELMGVEKGILPRRIAAANGKIYVSTYGSSAADWVTYATSGNGYVAAIDTTTFALSKTYTAGSFPEGVAVANGNLYVANSDYSMGSKASVSVINLSTGIDQPITGSQIVNPQSVFVSGSDLYVLDWGNYADILSGVRKITTNSTSTVLNGYAVSFSDNTLYACEATYGSITKEWVTYNVQTGVKKTYNNGLGDKFFYPNVIVADPISKKVYIASYSENANRPGTANYSSNGFIAEYDTNGSLIKTYECGVGPNAIVFNTGVRYE